MHEPRGPDRSSGRLPERRWPIIFGLVLACAALATAYWLAGLPVPGRVPSLAETRLREQTRTLHVYVGRGAGTSFLPPDDAVLAIHEQFLQRVMSASVPFRQEFANGRYVARLDSANIRVEDGLAIVTLLGRGLLADQQHSPIYADLLLQGVFTITGIDPDSGTLQQSIVITNMRVRRAGPVHLRGILNPVARYFGRLKVEDWNRLGRQVRLPVRLDRKLVLPALHGDVSVPETRIPISLRVSAVTALERRIVVSLALLPDATEGSEEPKGARVWDRTERALRRRRWPFGGSGNARSIVDLSREARKLADRDTLWRAATATNHDVVAVVPAKLLRVLVGRVSHRYLRGVVVDFRPEVRARLDKEIHVKVLGKRLGAGRVDVNVRLHHLRGRLTSSGSPVLRLYPPSELTVTLPMRVLAGTGVATFDMAWNPAKLVSLVCKGLETQRTLAGRIEPLSENLTTRVHFSVLGSRIVGRPRVERERIRMSVDLTEASWAEVRKLLVEQDRFSRCGLVMDPDEMLGKLRKLAERGVKFRLPAGIFEPFDLPVTLVGSRSAGQVRIEALAYAPEIVVQPSYLRLGFRANVWVRDLSKPTAQRPAAGSAPSILLKSPAKPASP